MAKLEEKFTTESKRGASIASSVGTIALFYVSGLAEIKDGIIRLPILNIPLQEKIAFPVMLVSIILVVASWLSRLFVEREHADVVKQAATEEARRRKNSDASAYKSLKSNVETLEISFESAMSGRKKEEVENIFFKNPNAMRGFRVQTRTDLEHRHPLYSQWEKLQEFRTKYTDQEAKKISSEKAYARLSSADKLFDSRGNSLYLYYPIGVCLLAAIGSTLATLRIFCPKLPCCPFN